MNDCQTACPEEQTKQHCRMNQYYRLHSHIYDATRWAFLFGRGRVLNSLPDEFKPKRILEVGCGTGKNLVAMRQKFPEAEITGLDISKEMLEQARKNLSPGYGRIRLVHAPYKCQLDAYPFDLILFSYCLTMINPGWQEIVQFAIEDLAPEGYLAIVDFHYSAFPAFRRWMRLNHVSMEAQILPYLSNSMSTEICEIRNAYCSLWKYFIFHGQKNNH